MPDTPLTNCSRDSQVAAGCQCPVEATDPQDCRRLAALDLLPPTVLLPVRVPEGFDRRPETDGTTLYAGRVDEGSTSPSRPAIPRGLPLLHGRHCDDERPERGRHDTSRPLQSRMRWPPSGQLGLQFRMKSCSLNAQAPFSTMHVRQATRSGHRPEKLLESIWGDAGQVTSVGPRGAMRT